MNISRSITILTVLALFFTGGTGLRAQESSSTNFAESTPVITLFGARSTSTNFEMFSAGGQVTSAETASAGFTHRGGFLFFPIATSPVLSATAGNGQVSLSWTASTATLANITTYHIGTATTSGGPYTFENVGNVTSFVKTGLTNGTTYYFKARALAGTLVLAGSNQASAAPAGTTPPPSGGGGGGGGGGGVPPPTSGTATVILSGLASPGASVTVLKDGQVATHTTADPGAGWSATLSGLSTGTYSFSVYASDTDGIQSSTVSFFQALTAGVTTRVENIFLSPTISASHSQIKYGDTINFFGFTAPESDLTLFVNSNHEVINVLKAGAGGRWFKAFNSALLEIGGHSARSQSSKDDLLSTYSPSVAFSVGDKNIEKEGEECRRSDLNCDGRVNITDFSILLFFWNQTSPANARADINTSGRVDLTDFSILLFDWTG